MKITKKNIRMNPIKASSYVKGADEDDFFQDESEGIMYEDDQTISDDIDALSDSVDELQDSVDDIKEDDIDIELDNNIENHYIAECENCHGIFISAMIESDQSVDKISGTCPLCDKETDQYFKWVVKSIDK